MSDVKRFQFEDNGEAFEIFIEAKSSPEIPVFSGDDDDPGGMGGVNDISVKMRQAQNMIRGYTLYALSAFKNLGDVNVEEISLKFGLKIGGKTGIPYITEGSADCNLEVSVKCVFPSRDNKL
ncbi:MAG: CU044_2847 family protein [Synechococcales bacterium]|nr:CU044_2847 family protein [Synechococcales bacterium]